MKIPKRITSKMLVVAGSCTVLAVGAVAAAPQALENETLRSTVESGVRIGESLVEDATAVIDQLLGRGHHGGFSCPACGMG